MFKELRLNYFETIESLCHTTGLLYQTVEKIEAGQYDVVSFADVEKYCTAIHIKIVFTEVTEKEFA